MQPVLLDPQVDQAALLRDTARRDLGDEEAVQRQGHDQVEKVVWASLPDNDFHDLAQKYTPQGSGAVVSFEIKGGVEAGKKFVEGLTLHSHLANIGDTKSLVIHNASTTHSQLNEEELKTYAPSVVFVDSANRPVELTTDAAHVPDGYGLVTGRV